MGRSKIWFRADPCGLRVPLWLADLPPSFQICNCPMWQAQSIRPICTSFHYCEPQLTIPLYQDIISRTSCLLCDSSRKCGVVTTWLAPMKGRIKSLGNRASLIFLIPERLPISITSLVPERIEHVTRLPCKRVQKDAGCPLRDQITPQLFFSLLHIVFIHPSAAHNQTLISSNMSSLACKTCRSYNTCVCASMEAEREAKESSRRREEYANEQRKLDDESKRLANKETALRIEQQQYDFDQRKKNAQ